MTAAQEEIFTKANELLKEHFEGFLVVCMDDDDSGRITTMQYHGGLLQAIGMARAAEFKLMTRQADAIAFRGDNEDEEDDDE